MLQVAVIKIMRLFVYIILPLLTMQSCMGGFDGPDVISKYDFENDKCFAWILLYGKCSEENPDPTESQLGSITVEFICKKNDAESLTRGLDKMIGLGAGERFITIKDRDLCVKSIISTSCGGRWSDSALVNDLLYCNPKEANMWQNQHFGQGNLITDKMRVRGARYK